MPFAAQAASRLGPIMGASTSTETNVQPPYEYLHSRIKFKLEKRGGGRGKTSKAAGRGHHVLFVRWGLCLLWGRRHHEALEGRPRR